MSYPHLAARVFNTPLLIHPGKLDALIAGLGGRLLGVDSSRIKLADSPLSLELGAGMFSTRRGERADRGYRVVDGVAVLMVGGALVHRSRLDGDSTWLTGYNDLAADAEDAMSNAEIHAVLQVYDTPGGECQGAFEFADRMYAMRGQKPLWSIADGMALSAGYLGGSAAERRFVTSTGMAGSIGVVCRHVDFSRMLEAEGITVEHVYAGDKKIDGNQFEPLPDRVRKEWQAEVDDLYQKFVATVVTHTGLTAEAVRGTQAGTYTGQGAVTAGLAERVTTTDQLIAELASQRARTYPAGASAQTTAAKGASMSGNNPGGQQAANLTPPAAAGATFTQADLDAARADGAKAERERVSAIMGHESAKGRTELAMVCVSTGLSAEQAGAMLAASPAAAPAAAAPQNELERHMASLGNPPIKGAEAPDPAAATAQAIDAAWDNAFKR